MSYTYWKTLNLHCDECELSELSIIRSGKGRKDRMKSTLLCWAEEEGWDVKGNRAVCPNCIGDSDGSALPR